MATVEKMPMLQEGYETLTADLKRLKTERPTIVEAIEEARAHGDLSENAEYHAAKERQGQVEASISDIEDKLSRAQIIDPKDLSGDKVVFGATVTLLDEDDKPITYQIVGQTEANAKTGRISYNSPIGRALIGRKVDEEVEVSVPSGDRYYVVSKIAFVWNRMSFWTARATAILTVATLVVSGLILMTDSAALVGSECGLHPLRFDQVAVPANHDFAVPAWATPLTATLIHGGWAHVALNLVMLAYCGQSTERAIGPVGVVMLYVVGAYAAALGHWAFGPHSVAPMIGASGAISAIVGAYALLYGERRAQPVGPVPAGVVHVLWLAAAWIGIQLLMGLAGFGAAVGASGPIAIGAHIGGFLAGLVLARPLLLWRYRSA